MRKRRLRLEIHQAPSDFPLIATEASHEADEGVTGRLLSSDVVKLLERSNRDPGAALIPRIQHDADAGPTQA